ncbi:MAG: hypothetical protein PHW46_04460 [Candidatus Omnitrophica bacterium]|nr:hypothetical protein [Candidatus Omnitrophota bacterium]
MRKIIIFLVFSCFILPQLAFAGAWTLPKGNIWLEETVKWMWARQDYRSDHGMARKNNDGRSTTFASISKAEYGIFDWLTFLSSIEYKEGNYSENARPADWGVYDVSNSAFTSLQLGAKVRVLKEPFVLSGQIRGEWYLGGKRYTDPVPGSATHASEDRPALSDGNNSLEFRALAGKKFDNTFFLPMYVGGEIGYKFNNRHVCNVVPFFIEGGVWSNKWLLIKSEIDGIWCQGGTGSIKKEYAIWRIGPVFQILDIIKALRGQEIKGDSYMDSVTLAGKSLNLELQYGNTFWGKNTSADQEVVMKISGQF